VAQAAQLAKDRDSALAAARAAQAAGNQAEAEAAQAKAQAIESERQKQLAQAAAADAEIAKQQALADAAAAEATKRVAIAQAAAAETQRQIAAALAAQAGQDRQTAIDQKNAALQAQAQAEAQRDQAVQQRNDALIAAMQVAIQQAQATAQIQAQKEQIASQQLAAQQEKERLIQAQITQIKQTVAKAQAEQEAAVQKAVEAERAKIQALISQAVQQERNSGTCPSLSNGTNVRNTEKQIFKFENGKLRLYPSQEVYKSYGSPSFAEGYREVDLAACPRGPDMALTCPTTQFKDGDIIVNGTDGTAYKVFNGTLRRVSNDVYRALGSPQFKTFGAELQQCPTGPVLELDDVVTLAPTSSPSPSQTTTPIPTRQNGSLPPTMLRSPNAVVFVHARTWLTQGKLAVLGLQNGVLLGGPLQGLSNVFKISSEGVLATLSGVILAAAADCSLPQAARSNTAAPWDFQQLSNSPLHFSLSPTGCDKALGLRANGSQALLLEKGDKDASWFILPIQI
jgi:hypothetical protein